jgi:heme-degrading monooxygenase HmoA
MPLPCMQQRFWNSLEMSVIQEVAILNVRAGCQTAFEAAFSQAAPIIAASPGYISHQLKRCLESRTRYLLLVNWRSLEDHTQGFRGSSAYQQWKALLHHFYDPFPTVEHYEALSPEDRLTIGALR